MATQKELNEAAKLGTEIRPFKSGKRPSIPVIKNTNRLGLRIGDLAGNPDKTPVFDSAYYAKIKAEVIADGQNYLPSKEAWTIFDEHKETYTDEYLQKEHSSRAYTSTTSIYNTTGLPITVVHRNNMKFLLPNDSPMGLPGDIPGIVIETTYKLTTASLRTFVKTMIANPRKYSKELLENLTETLRDRTTGHSMKSEYFTFTSRILIPYEAITREKLIYNARTDYAFYCGEPHRAPDHPLYGDSFVDDVYSNFFVNSVSISSVIDIIDNENTVSGKKFVNLLGKVIAVNVRRDPVLASGIYLITKQAGDEEAITETTPLTEGVNVGVFNSREEAEAGGDISSANNIKVEALKQENAVLAQETVTRKLELEKSKADIEKERIEHEKELTELKDRLAKLQLQLEERKTSTARTKSGGDAIKYGLGLATAVVGLMTFIWSAVTA